MVAVGFNSFPFACRSLDSPQSSVYLPNRGYRVLISNIVVAHTRQFTLPRFD